MKNVRKSGKITHIGNIFATPIRAVSDKDTV